MATAAEAIQAISSAADRDLATLVQSSRSVAGFSESLFHHARELLGSNPNRARLITALWKRSADAPESDAWSLRIKSIHHRLNGEWIKSVNAAREAGSRCESGRDRAVFQIGSIDALGRAGRLNAAVQLAEQLFAELERLGDRFSGARVAINAGNALLWQDRFEEARPWFDAALERISKSDHAYEWASVTLGLSTIELYTGSAERATMLGHQAADVLQANGHTAHSEMARINEAHALIHAGRADEAVQLLLRIRDSKDVSPFDAARCEEFLGDAYLQLNLWREAAAAYRTAFEIAALKASPMNLANTSLGLAEALKGIGDLAAARSEVERAQRLYAKFGNKRWVEVARAVRGEIEFELGEFEYSIRSARTARKRLMRWGFKRHAARAFLVECKATYERGSLNSRTLSQLSESVERSGAIDLDWQVSYLKALSARGKTRLRAFRQMFESILAVRALTVSSSARVAFFKDKVRSVGAYLDALLTDSASGHLQEVFRILESTRSVALLDELVSERHALGEGDVGSRLESLRREFARLTERDVAGGPERRIEIGKEDFSSLQRKWHELSGFASVGQQPSASATKTPCPVLTETNQALYALFPDEAILLPISPSDLRRLLNWTYFELLSPRIESRPDVREIDRLLDEVRTYVLKPLAGKNLDHIALDGVFWSIPWQIIGDFDSSEFVISPQVRSATKVENPRTDSVAIWYHSRSDLPHIEGEVESLRRRFPDAVVCDSLDKVRGSMISGHFDLVHIATHAHYHRSNPLFSALSFDGGMLPAIEIARAKMRVGHVTLAACETGIVGKPAGFEIDGLTRSFLSLGANSILATQWALHDASSAYYMSEFYERLGDGMPVQDCVRTARLKTKNRYEHPYFWGAPYLVAGLGGDQ